MEAETDSANMASQKVLKRAGFVKNNVLYHYPINKDKLKIGKFCSIAYEAKFIFTSASHTLSSLSTYPFPIFLKNGT